MRTREEIGFYIRELEDRKKGLAGPMKTKWNKAIIALKWILEGYDK